MGQPGGSWWDAEEMLNLYLHDYLAKKNMHQTAAIFRNEANVPDLPVAIDSPEGFLHEWWSIFYDVFASRMSRGSGAEASFKGVKLTEVQLHNIDRLALGSLINHQVTGQFSVGTDCSKLFVQDAAYPLAFRNHEAGRCVGACSGCNPNLLRSNVNQPTFLMPFAANSSSHKQQQMPGLVLQQEKFNCTDGGRSRRMDGQLYREPKSFQVTGHPTTGMPETERVNTLPLYGCPLDVINSTFHAQHYQKQFKMLTAKQPEGLRSPGIPRNLNYGPDGSSAESKCHNVMSPSTNASRYRAQMVQMTQTPDCQRKGSEIQQEENATKRMRLMQKTAAGRILEPNKVQDYKTVDENIVASMQPEDDRVSNRGTPFENLRQHSSTCNKNKPKGFTFQEIGCLQSSIGKVRRCHFSSDGKLLATAANDKVCIWNMGSLDIVNTSDQYPHLITDVRFKPGSTVFATSFYDKSVQIWDAAIPSRSLSKLMGHAEPVMSLDFHPMKADVLCSCDTNDVIRLWDLKHCTCLRTLRGGTKQVRFQPELGKLIATASGKQVNVIDVETGTLLFSLMGHSKQVLSICWDQSGKHIASISEDRARLWSVSSQEWSAEVLSNSNKFLSCTFHPSFSQFLIIGSHQSLELWNPSERSRRLTVEAHRGLVSSLADCPETGMVASASYDQCVKLWK